MHRFFLPPECFQGQTVTFPPEVAHQVSRVLRLRPGDQVIAIDSQTIEHTVALLSVEKTAVIGQILSQQASTREPYTQLSLYLSLTQREKFEWMLQKCTELGAATFIPLITSRSLVQREREATGKLQRWQKIVLEAAEQSGRGRVPPVRPPLHFASALQSAQQENDLLLIPWEQEQVTSLRQALDNFVTSRALQQSAINRHKMAMRIAVFVGPEGGFSFEEISQARHAGFQTVTLGPRILRMETAAIAATALLIDQFN